MNLLMNMPNTILRTMRLSVVASISLNFISISMYVVISTTMDIIVFISHGAMQMVRF